MNFTTPVEVPKCQLSLRPQDKIMLMGSCFAQEIGNRLQADKLDCDVNPFGVLYNPASLCLALERMMDGAESFSTDELFEHEGQWHSWMHHSSFSAATPEACLERINTRLAAARKRVKLLDVLVLTLGTNRCYVSKSTGKLAGNCHKLPESEFTVIDLSVDKMVFVMTAVIDALRLLNPSLRVVLTVSPIRYAKYGFHGSQLSKAMLLCAIEQLCLKFPDNIFYFPAYEIQLDELRDYRFYADDMLHPSAQAIDYIYERFSQTCFSDEARRLIAAWQEIRRGLEHRPFDADSERYHNFIRQIVLKIEQLKAKYPYLAFEKELTLCHTRLKPLKKS